MRWTLFLLLVTGCATSPSNKSVSPPMPTDVRPQVMTALTFAQPMAVLPVPQIGPTLVMVDKCDWHAVYPDGFPSTNYNWTVQVATNIVGDWVDQPQEWYNDTTLLVHSPPMPFYLRLHGTTNDSQ